jgi:flagellin
MSFSINTNVTSLQAQNALRASSDFQSKTINRVTTGLRIVNSGDDAAGLAVANGFRSDQAVLTQGIRNAGDGLSTLQTIDGGMNNISLLLDRARTLATQSASTTFAGDRSQLNSEFTNVLSEIDRQSQAVGMNTGGQYAKALSTFIGGGKDTTGLSANSAAITNGTVSVNLSTSAVDTKALGLSTFKTVAPTTTTLATVVDAGNLTGNAMSFDFRGAGFSDGNDVVVTATGVNAATSMQGVVDKINAGIAAAAQNVGTNYTAFKTAGITASLTSDGTGIQFSSASSQFSVSADATTGTAAAQNILGTSGTAAVSAGGSQAVTLGWGGDLAAGVAQQLVISSTDTNGNQISTKVNLVATDTKAQSIALINTALQAASGNNANLNKIVAVDEDSSNVANTGAIKIMGAQNFQVFIGQATVTATGVASATGIDSDNTSKTMNTSVTSASSGNSGAVDISTAADAQQAVNALANAVSTLGTAQANVGKGENQFNYAMNLAQSQSTNLAAAESRIRDADLASEAANLTKAQILTQAGTAALAQANSAPQAILSLLKG